VRRNLLSAAIGVVDHPNRYDGSGLRFSVGDGEVPERIKREWQQIPPWVMAEFSRHHDSPRENERAMNAL
jgi:hypothetical protein